jgi:cyclin-dependent kinase regulatory subunit CKS1
MSKKQIYYSDKYTDEEFEYRHVMLPKDLAKMVPKTHLMSETEWRNLGVQQSQGKINLVKVLLLIFRCNLSVELMHKACKVFLK